MLSFGKGELKRRKNNKDSEHGSAVTATEAAHNSGRGKGCLKNSSAGWVLEHACDPSYTESINRRTTVQVSPGKN
jgi:hypothetical protein